MSVISSAPGGVLALDLSTHVGWAYAQPGGTPISGVWHLKGQKLGHRFMAFENELIRMLGARLPRLVIVEAPLPATAQRSSQAARSALGLAAYVDSETCRAGIECREGQVNQVRLNVLGKGTFGNSEANKAAVMKWCQDQGWTPPDHNAADACVLWQYACNVWVRKGRIVLQ